MTLTVFLWVHLGVDNDWVCGHCKEGDETTHHCHTLEDPLPLCHHHALWRKYLLLTCTYLQPSLVPRLLFTEQENSLVNCPYIVLVPEITVTSRQLDCVFKNALVNSKL